MSAYLVNVAYNPVLLRSRSLISVNHNGTVATDPPGHISLGRDEILDEFLAQKSARSHVWNSFLPQISRLPTSERRAAFASKMIELSVLHHPRKAELGLPVDVLQFRATDGAIWISAKPNCQQK